MKIEHIKTILFLIMILYNITVNSQKDTIYYDQKWDETTKPNASFYRPMPLEQDGNKSLIKDYYIDGTLQFEAWQKPGDSTQTALFGSNGYYDGTVVWYYPNGNKKTETNYTNNKRNGAEITYYENGKIESEKQIVDDRTETSKSYNKKGELRGTLIYKDGYPEEGVSTCFKQYKNGKEIKKILYYENTNIPAFVSKCSEKGCYNGKKETYYDKKAVIIQENKISEEKLEVGRIIEFFEAERCGYVKAIKSIKTIANGDANGQIIRYDLNGAELYKGTYKDDKPQDGTFELKDYSLTFISEYKNGSKNGQEIVLNDGKKIAEGNYVDGKRQNGSFVEERQFTRWSKRHIILNLKNGIEDGQQKFYNVARDIIMGYYHVKDGKKEGAYAVFDYDGELLAKATYKNGKPFEGTVISNDDRRFYKNGERLRENIHTDLVEKKRMEAFSKGSDTIEGGYNMGGFETASSIVFLDTHQFFFSLSVGSLDLRTYGVYHLKNGKIKLQVPKEQKQAFLLYGRNNPDLKDSIQINYYNYDARSKPIIQLNKQWYALENLKQQQESESFRSGNEGFKIDLNKLSTLKIGIKKESNTVVILKNILEAETITDFNDFIIAYNVVSEEITQIENSEFMLNGENIVNGDKEIKKKAVDEESKENVLDYIIENRAFPYYIKRNTFQKIKLNSKKHTQKITKYKQLKKSKE